MEKPRPILYGVADYAQIRKKNAWFVDRTAKIRDLEDIAYAVFLRPRRFVLVFHGGGCVLAEEV